MKLVASGLLAMLLVGCGGAPSRPPGPPVLAVSAGQAGALLKDLRKDLGSIEADGLDEGIKTEISDGQLLVELQAGAFFEEGNAQVKLVALKPLADIAAAIRARGGCVVHVVGLAADSTALELAERRSATVAEDLVRRSIAAERVRRESRESGDRADRILLVLRPVIIGREAQAWVPPTLDE